MTTARDIREFHLFAGIGGGIYGGKLLGHTCCGGVEINEFCHKVLKQRQSDGWMDPFDIYGDLRTLDGKAFIGKFDVLCGGFPCQAFSTAAHGKNIASKNLWDEMLRFVVESEAPVVFGENVVLKAIAKAKGDLEGIGYSVKIFRLGCGDLGADHERNRFWLLAVKDTATFAAITEHAASLPKLTGAVWGKSPDELGEPSTVKRHDQLTGVGNAQSPFVAATAFRILVNRHLDQEEHPPIVSEDELAKVFERRATWIARTFGPESIPVHTPTTMANYSCPYMMRHRCCRNFKAVFGRPSTQNAEYLMGFPIGASSPLPQPIENLNKWRE